MPAWSAEQQVAAQLRYDEFLIDVSAKFQAWINGIQAGNPKQHLAALEDSLRKWRANIQSLRENANMAINDEAAIDALGVLVRQVQEEKGVLAELRSQAGTRADQADSVNPKTQPSPYINILGLQRTFRSSTRNGLIIAAVVFGVLALGVLGFIGYQSIVMGVRPTTAATASATATSGPFQAGGGRRH